jgi:single-stranded-DNA-specific exonuclease
MKKHIEHRVLPDNYSKGSLADHPVLDRIYVARGVEDRSELEQDLSKLLPYQSLMNIDQAVLRLCEAFEKQEHICIVGDFDADGATSTTLAVKILTALGAKHVSYLVPNRFEYGYGLTPEIVDLARERNPQLIITVDNGITSVSGVDRANELGIDVIVTDHHLPGDVLPKAVTIINPNQHGDKFESKNLAGCGVIFYVMLALRAGLREKNWFKEKKEPNLAEFLDILALGTVADVVPLDKNNRILVQQGLKRIRAKKCVPGIKALLEIGKRDLSRVVASDLGFAVAPRLNAAGRLDDMTLGIECLLAENSTEACKLAFKLDDLNKERRQIEDSMKEEAFRTLSKIDLDEKQMKKGLCLFGKDWHQGVIGILASRIKDKYYRPTVIFASGDNNDLKASGRSIPGFHLRDCFERISTKHPNLIQKFGGHAMAAGLTINQDQFETFIKAFNDDVDKHLDNAALENKVLCDGELVPEDLNLNLAELLKQSGPWGQAFPEPLFVNRFRIIEQRIVGEKHLKLNLAIEDKCIDAILFFVDLESWPNHRCEFVNAVYSLDVNEFRGRRTVQLMVNYIEPA